MFIHKLSRFFILWVIAVLCLTACASPTSSPGQSSPTTAPTEAQLTAEAQPTPEIQATQDTQVTPEVKPDEADDESEIDSDELEVENESDEAGGQPKVTICHNASKNNPHSITIAQPALKAHLAHGDTPGPCA